MRFALESYHCNVRDADLIADLQRVARELGTDSVTVIRYRKHGKYAPCTIEKRFGSWNKGLEVASLTIEKRNNIPEEELFANLEKLWRKFGRQPRYRELSSPDSLFGHHPYEKRFGSYRKALQTFVDYMNQEEAEAPPISNSKVQPKTPRQPNLRLQWRVLKRDRYRCCHCGRSPSIHPGLILQVDHIIPWSKSGLTVEENLQTLCSNCNQGKGNELESTP
jgi:HNH endonuclease/Homing endonuclease associated repeat